MPSNENFANAIRLELQVPERKKGVSKVWVLLAKHDLFLFTDCFSQ